MKLVQFLSLVLVSRLEQQSRSVSLGIGVAREVEQE